MRKAFCLACGVLALAGIGTGCGSLRVIEGSPTPPTWVTDYTTASNYTPNAYIYASGISTYTVVLEDGINDARHDAIRKIVEQIGVAADDSHRTDRNDKQGVVHTGMPNVPQAIMNSGRAVDVARALEARKTRTPQATHVSRTRIHGIEACLLDYTVWRYTPGWWARLFGNDTQVRFYDVYTLVRCPREEFESAMKVDKKWDDAAELSRPALTTEKK